MASLSAEPHVPPDYVSRELIVVLLIAAVACVPAWPVLRGWIGHARERLGTAGRRPGTGGRGRGRGVVHRRVVQPRQGTYNPFIYFRF